MNADLWLRRFQAPRLIRRHVAVELLAARDASGQARFVVTGSKQADRERTKRRFDEVARVHERVQHPRIPRLVERSAADDVEFLSFDCDVAADGPHVLERFAATGQRLPYEAADAFIYGLREALEAAHSVADPQTGRPTCIGRIAYENLMFATDGRYWLFGLGHNLVVERDTGVLSGVHAFLAPEIGAGAPPSPSGDYVALLLLMRSLLPYATLPPPLSRVVTGQIEPKDAELLMHVLWVERQVVSAPPHSRASIADAVEVADKIRELMHTRLDHEGFARAMGQLLGADQPAQLEVTVGSQAAYVVLPSGEHVDLTPHASLRRIVAAMTDRLRHGGTADASWSASELIAAGWPDEKIEPNAAKNRLYVAIGTLRKLGLRGLIERRGRGYGFAEGVLLRFDPTP